MQAPRLLVTGALSRARVGTFRVWRRRRRRQRNTAARAATPGGEDVSGVATGCRGHRSQWRLDRAGYRRQCQRSDGYTTL